MIVFRPVSKEFVIKFASTYSYNWEKKTEMGNSIKLIVYYIN